MNLGAWSVHLRHGKSDLPGISPSMQAVLFERNSWLVCLSSWEHPSLLSGELHIVVICSSMLNNKQADAIFSWSYYIFSLCQTSTCNSTTLVFLCFVLLYSHDFSFSFSQFLPAHQLLKSFFSGRWCSYKWGMPISLHFATYIGMWRNSILVANLKYSKFHFLFSLFTGLISLLCSADICCCPS